MPAVKTSLGDRLLEMADRLDAEIQNKLANRLDNTPKRQKEAACARIEGNHLQRTQVVLRVLGTMHQHGLVPPALAGAKTKNIIHDALRTRVDTSGGYYSVRDTGEYSRTDELSKAIQKVYSDATSSPEQQARAAEQAHQQKIREMEANIRFANIPGFFPTPPAVIDLMLEHADLQADSWLLEPSAGKGDILDAVLDAYCLDKSRVFAIERNCSLCEILQAKGYTVTKGDFLQTPGTLVQINRILMNPPFENGQDITHVMHAYDVHLTRPGKLVSVMSSAVVHRDDRKTINFRDWLKARGGEVVDLGPGAFKNGFVQTGVSTVLVVIDK